MLSCATPLAQRLGVLRLVHRSSRQTNFTNRHFAVDDPESGLRIKRYWRSRASRRIDAAKAHLN
jgi:hypothetical protein